MNTNERVSLAAVGGAAAGVGLVFGLREADKQLAKSYISAKASNASTTPPLLMKQLGNFGSPSAIGGIGVGIGSLAFGLYGAHKGKYLRTPDAQVAVSSFGGAALTTGVISGIMPTSEWSSAVATDPSNGIGFNRSAKMTIGGARSSPALAYVNTA